MLIGTPVIATVFLHFMVLVSKVNENTFWHQRGVATIQLSTMKGKDIFACFISLGRLPIDGRSDARSTFQ